MKTNILDLLDYLIKTGESMDNLKVVKSNSKITLKDYFGVRGESEQEETKRGLYLYNSFADTFIDDTELLNMADEIYSHESYTAHILYFEID